MRILVASTAFPAAPQVLSELLPGDEIVVGAERADGDFDVIVPLMSRIDGAAMDRLKPRLIQQFGVGLEGIDLAAARERGIPVANVGASDTGNADGVGEVALLHLLTLMRRYSEATRAVAESRLGDPTGTSLSGARVVVLGLGAVGRAVVTRLTGFGAKLIGVGSRPAVEVADTVGGLGLAGYWASSALLEALDGADALVICCALTDATRGIVDARAIGAMRPGAYLVNVARGPVVDYDGLLASLRSGQLAGAGLDVFWDEPIDPADPLLAENVSATSHIGGVTTVANRRTAEAVAANVERLRRGESIT